MPSAGSVRSRHRPIIYGRTHMVSAGHHHAAQAGFSILEAGGNAVDAGVASIMALAVVQPDVVNIAGVAPILIYLAETGETVSISGLGTWPKAATAEYFEREHGGAIPEGILRTVVPGAPDAWITALERYGTMRFGDVAAYAIRLARDGFPAFAFLTERLHEYEASYRRFPSNTEIYMPGGAIPKPGELFVQADLGRSLQYMADEEAAAGGREAGLAAARKAFYEGDIARTIVAFHEANGGFMTMEDMAGFRVGHEPPVRSSFGDLDVVSCGPWCQGPVLGQMLNMLDGRDLAALGHNSPDYIHLLTEVIKLAFADRERHYGDPRFVDVPIEGLLSKAYAEARMGLFDPEKAWPAMPPAGDPANAGPRTPDPLPDPVASPLPAPMAAPYRTPPGDESGGDTSYACVVDRHGNVFSATPSDSSWDGVAVPGTGMVPSSRGSQSRGDPRHPASVAPGKRPRLTPNPAILFRNGRPIMPLGTPGGDAQAQAMLQVILNMFVFGMDVQSATEAPRFMSQSFPNSFAPNHYFPGRLNLEARLGDAIAAPLAARGHTLYWWPDWFWRLGSVCAIYIDPDTGLLHGGADPRQESYALGW
ncbi:gamma-glutamyltransferase family protein [Acuticoccus kandeliae]|uniref:gamma-glutamyltransferase family protein n=1 Tax=Acuticoccus kandeliae TaxID=2073160 RepID=UPI000D3ECE08|nr:gamma-glutamyltransferase family protein [Acuticoccus kandeliae]